MNLRDEDKKTIEHVRRPPLPWRNRDGVDSFAYWAAIGSGLVPVLVVANPKHGWKAAGPRRNPTIADIADQGIAFQYRESRGTQHTIDLFERAGKPCEVRRKP
jgi:hypothetical protein